MSLLVRKGDHPFYDCDNAILKQPVSYATHRSCDDFTPTARKCLFDDSCVEDTPERCSVVENLEDADVFDASDRNTPRPTGSKENFTGLSRIRRLCLHRIGNNIFQREPSEVKEKTDRTSENIG